MGYNGGFLQGQKNIRVRMSLPKQRFVPFLAGMRKIYPETACMVVTD